MNPKKKKAKRKPKYLPGARRDVYESLSRKVFGAEEIESMSKDVERAISLAAEKVATRCAFGIYEKPDMKSECWVWGLEALKEYPGDVPLFTYIYRCMLNRASNFWRQKFWRMEPPRSIRCKECGRDCRSDPDFQCPIYMEYYERNKLKAQIECPMYFSPIVRHGNGTEKRNVAKPNGCVGSTTFVDINQFDREIHDPPTRNGNALENDLDEELRNVILDSVPAELRMTLLKMIYRDPLQKQRKFEKEIRSQIAVREAVYEALEHYAPELVEPFKKIVFEDDVELEEKIG